MAELRRKNAGAVRLCAAAAAFLPALAGCASFGAVFAPSGSGMSGQKAVLASLEQGLLGSQARALSSQTRKQALLAEYKALEYNKAGQSVSWKSADGNASGTVLPGQPYRVGEQNCRQYSHDWSLRGVPHSARGSACRNADGSWTPLT